MHELAYWDLKVANELAPNNLEVTKKLKQVEKSVSASTVKCQQYDEVPTGLGNGLPSPKKKIKSQFVKECEEEKVGEQEERSKLHDIKVFQEMKETLKVGDVDMKDLQREESNGSMMDDELHDVFNPKDNNVQMSVVDEGMEKQMKKDEVDSSVKEKHDQAKLKYRFINQRRPGSFLFISGKDYARLQKGDSIQYANNNMSVMTIRVVQGFSLHKDMTEIHCDQSVWDAVDEFNSRDDVKDMKDQTFPYTSEADEAGTMSEAVRRTEICKVHIPKRKRKHRLSLAVSLRKMKKVDACVPRKRRSILSVCDGSFKVIKAQFSQKFKGRKEKSHRLTWRNDDHQQGRKEAMSVIANCQFRFSAMKTRNFRGVKYHTYRDIINKRRKKKQMHRGNMRIIGQKRK